MQSYAAPRYQNPNPNAGARYRGISSAGTFRCSRREMILEAFIYPGNSGYFTLNPLQFPWLKGVANSFDKFKFLSLKIHYRPAVGTGVAGALSFGIDWDSQLKDPVDYSYVSSLTPVNDVPVWQMASMVVPSNKLMSRKEYFVHGNAKIDDIDTAPGYLVYSSTATATAKLVIGHFWADYDIVFSGTTST